MKSNDDLSDPVYYLKDMVVNKDYEGIAYLIEAGFDVNATDYDDGSALIVAVDEDNVEMVKFLLNLGANMTIKDYSGWTALEYAKRYGHQEIATVLEEAGALE